jgi:class 3 adenylate cyclase
MLPTEGNRYRHTVAWSPSRGHWPRAALLQTRGRVWELVASSAWHETVPVELPPTTRYARRGDLKIAYQVFGSGAQAVVMVPALPSHLDLMWTEAPYTRWLRRLATFARVVIFDRPGLGLSDPVDRVPTLEDQAHDLRAVMDDAGVERATLHATAFCTGGVVLFASQWPERVDSLLLWGPFAQSWRTGPEDELVGWDGRSRAVGAAWDDVVEHWGEGRSLQVYAPGLSGGRLRRAWGMIERASASPAMVRVITEAELCADLTEILPLVAAPTVVVLHADSGLPQGAARYVSELMPNATFTQLPPSSEATGLGDWSDPVFAELERLMTGQRIAPTKPDRILATVLFTDIVDSTAHAARLGDEQWRVVNDRHHSLVRDHVERSGGQLIQTAGDGTLSALPGPAQAIRCAQTISHAVEELGIRIRAGIHTGECERTGDNLAGLSVHIGARVGAAAGPGEVWVSRTVRDLVAGSGIRLQHRGPRHLKGVPEPWELFSLVEAEDTSAPMARPPRLKVSDRIVLAAARRAPGLLRAVNRG